ncbi:MAG TPA: hypothetical protein PK453_12930, partial [Leptospiraceae bacterium]|nr:hypothetical protein [Leptospiraceae bacterium]
NNFLYCLIVVSFWTFFTAYSLAAEECGSVNIFQIECFIENTLFSGFLLFSTAGISSVLSAFFITHFIMNMNGRKDSVVHSILFTFIIIFTVRFFYTMNFSETGWRPFFIGYLLTLISYAILQYFRKKLS